MTAKTNRILAVIDPTRNDQWALQKAISIAKDTSDTEVCAFLCAYSRAECDDPEELRSVELGRHTNWLVEMLAVQPDAGVTIEPLVTWNADWRDAICQAAKASGTYLVVKRASGRPHELGSADRQLIRSLQSALLLVKADPAEEIRKVLVAVDFNAVDRGHVALNDAIMTLGSRIRGSNGTIELHSVSAYPKSDKFVHPPDVAKILDIDRSHAHVRLGSAAEVIPDMANKIQADLVIVGSVGRNGFSGVTTGNTAEKILTDIESDVLVLVKHERRERSAA